MVLYILFLVVLLCWKSKPVLSGFHGDYISRDSIQPIKGLFLLLVFASHFVQYVTLQGWIHAPYLQIRAYLGQMVVVPFLFYSGYGVAESIRKKGPSYVSFLPTHRILMVLFQFDVAVALFVLIQHFLGKSFTAKRVFFSLLGWDGVGNSNWYIFAILALYTFTFLAFWAFGEAEKRFAANLSLTLLTVFFFWFMGRHRDVYWYNTVLAYVAGSWFSMYKAQIEKFLFHKSRSYWFLLFLFVASFYILRKTWASIVAYEVSSVVFAAIILMISAKWKITNRFLAYCGKHLFSLFILQRLSMIIFSYTSVSQNIALYFISSFVLTFIISAIFDRLVPILWKPIQWLFDRIQLKIVNLRIFQGGHT